MTREIVHEKQEDIDPLVATLPGNLEQLTHPLEHPFVPQVGQQHSPFRERIGEPIRGLLVKNIDANTGTATFRQHEIHSADAAKRKGHPAGRTGATWEVNSPLSCDPVNDPRLF